MVSHILKNVRYDPYMYSFKVTIKREGSMCLYKEKKNRNTSNKIRMSVNKIRVIDVKRM
jgi:hypothetical protein